MRFGVIASLAGLTLLGVIYLAGLRPTTAPLPDLGEAPSFTLTDQHDRAFSSEVLKDKVWLANFFFTSCEGPCPITMSAVASIAKRFENNDGIQFVSITSDPVTDTPRKLAEYAAKFPSVQRSYLTGTQDQILKISTEGFRLGLTPDPNIHSTRLVLIDRHARIRGYYSAADEASLAKLVDDLQKLIKQ